MICLAFLAPDILDQIAAGTQPVAFTSERFKTRHLPFGWNEQRKITGGL
jgi:site-specific DNA recombinase